MALVTARFTNIWNDTQVTTYSPDCVGDYYDYGDAQLDHNYMQHKVAQVIKEMNNWTIDCIILYGGDISAGTTNTVCISAGAALSKNSLGAVRLVTIPAQTNIPLPALWNNDREIFVKLVYNYTLVGGSTRNHLKTSELYNSSLNDSFLGAGATATAELLFSETDPNAGTADTCVCLGSFKMNGSSFTLQSGHRSPEYMMKIGYTNTAASPIIQLSANTGIFYPAAHTVAFSSNGSEKMRLQATTTAAAPALCLDGELDTGIWTPAANVWAVSNNGVETLRLTETHQVSTGGEATPLCSANGMHLFISSAGTINSVSADADDLVIESSANTGITLLCGASSTGSIYFGDDSSTTIGRIVYNHTTNAFTFLTGASLGMTLDGSQALTIAGGISQDGEAITHKHYQNIGVWDMSGGVSLELAITGALADLTKVKKIEVLILDDDSTRLDPLLNDGGITAHVGHLHLTGLTTWQTTSYNGSGNRGFVVIEYID